MAAMMMMMMMMRGEQDVSCGATHAESIKVEKKCRAFSWGG
jgi:hypothetical protein